MKTVIIVALIFVALVAASRYANKRSQTTSNETVTPSPTPMIISFNRSQQCSDDANRLVNDKQQAADKQWQIAHQYHTGYTTIELKESAFSVKLNTCVAEIDETIFQDGTSLMTNYVYDSVNNKILAQYFTPDTGNANFIVPLQSGRALIKNFTFADLADYETSIGL